MSLLQICAIIFAAVIVARVICVVYRTTARHHRHPLLFLGFGYSYVLLAAGAIFAAVALCARADLVSLALWLLLGGSAGLIVFDRRAARCWSVSDCPLDCPADDKEP
jgi:hypothetical protein